MKNQKRLAWTQFYWRDWLSDIALRSCTLEARGLWMDMLAIAHQEGGYLIIGGEPVTPDDTKALALMVGQYDEGVNPLVKALVKAGVCSIDETTGGIYSRRMVSDFEKHERNVANGKRGGNPTLRDRTTKPIGVNPPVKAPLKAPVNPPVNPEDNPPVKPWLKLRDQSPEVEGSQVERLASHIHDNPLTLQSHSLGHMADTQHVQSNQTATTERGDPIAYRDRLQAQRRSLDPIAARNGLVVVQGGAGELNGFDPSLPKGALPN